MYFLDEYEVEKRIFMAWSIVDDMLFIEHQMGKKAPLRCYCLPIDNTLAQMIVYEKGVSCELSLVANGKELTFKEEEGELGLEALYEYIRSYISNRRVNEIMYFEE